MTRLVVAIIVGVLFAVGAAFLATGTLSSVANGSPSSASLYNYGHR